MRPIELDHLEEQIIRCYINEKRCFLCFLKLGSGIRQSNRMNLVIKGERNSTLHFAKSKFFKIKKKILVLPSTIVGLGHVESLALLRWAVVIRGCEAGTAYTVLVPPIHHTIPLVGVAWTYVTRGPSRAITSRRRARLKLE